MTPYDIRMKIVLNPFKCDTLPSADIKITRNGTCRSGMPGGERQALKDGPT